MLKALFGRLNSHWRQARAVRLRRSVRKRAKRYRPLVEGLEVRDLLAFNLFITPGATANVSSATANGTTTFTAAAAGANLNVDDIGAALNAGNNVVVTSGSSGTQAGTIGTSEFNTHLFNNAPGTTLTIQNGTGNGSDAGDINITGLRLRTGGTMILAANDQVRLDGTISANTMTIAAGGTITMPNGGQLVADSLSLTAGGDIGTPAATVFTNVDEPTTNTSVANADQFITEANGLTELNLNAGTGAITFNVTLGAVADADAAVDIAAASISVPMQDPSIARDFGSAANPIGTSVDGLNVNTVLGGGSQFITQSKALTAIGLFADVGNVSLTVLAGSVTDADGSDDLFASSASITLNDATAKNFGSAAIPIKTAVQQLTVNTSAGGGNQFITEANGLTALNLNAGSGDVALFVTTGAVADSSDNLDIDITADGAFVQMDDTTVRDFGTLFNPIGTSVNSLAVFTNGGGSQFIREANGLTALNLGATAAGNVTLNVLGGAVTDTDAASDIVAAAAVITLSDTNFTRDFGAAANPIRTRVSSLSVDTSARGGSQFITEDDGLTAVNIATFTIQSIQGTRDVTLTITAGSVSDTDAGDDIGGRNVAVVLSDTTAQNFGAAANPINTSVIDLTVSTTTGGGSQFITEINGLTGLSLSAGTGNVNLALTLGDVADADTDVDITAATADVSLLDPNSKRNFGSLANPIETNVNTLAVNTAVSSGDQFIAETNNTFLTSDAGAADTTLVGGTFDLGAGDTISDESTLVVNSPAVVNLVTGDEGIGGLAGNGIVSLAQSGVGQILTIDDRGQSHAFSGIITGSGEDVLIKGGSGTQTFSGNHTFAGIYAVAEGTVLVTGNLSSGADFQVGGFGPDLEAFLGGTGTINRNVVVGSGGHLAPGTSTGELTMANLSFLPGSTLDVEITSAAVGAFDQVLVINPGEMKIDTTGVGVALNIQAAGTVDLEVDDKLFLAANQLPFPFLQGTFANFPDGAILGSNFLGAGLTAQIKYLSTSVTIELSPGSLFPWHNEAKALDVNGGQNNAPDDHIVAGDALAVINYLNAFGSGAVPASAVLGLPFGFLDTDGDNFVTAGDALDVINFLNAGLGGEGEGEASAECGVDPQSGYPGAECKAGPAAVVNDEELIGLLAMDVAEVAGRRRR